MDGVEEQEAIQYADDEGDHRTDEYIFTFLVDCAVGAAAREPKDGFCGDDQPHCGILVEQYE